MCLSIEYWFGRQVNGEIILVLFHESCCCRRRRPMLRVRTYNSIRGRVRVRVYVWQETMGASTIFFFLIIFNCVRSTNKNIDNALLHSAASQSSQPASPPAQQALASSLCTHSAALHLHGSPSVYACSPRAVPCIFFGHRTGEEE